MTHTEMFGKLDRNVCLLGNETTILEVLGTLGSLLTFSYRNVDLATDCSGKYLHTKFTPIIVGNSLPAGCKCATT